MLDCTNRNGVAARRGNSKRRRTLICLWLGYGVLYGVVVANTKKGKRDRSRETFSAQGHSPTRERHMQSTEKLRCTPWDVDLYAEGGEYAAIHSPVDLLPRGVLHIF